MVCEGQASLPHPGLAQRKARTAPPWSSGSPQSDGERRSTLGSPPSDGRGCPIPGNPKSHLVGEAVGSFQSEEGETALPMESTV